MVIFNFDLVEETLEKQQISSLYSKYISCFLYPSHFVFENLNRCIETGYIWIFFLIWKFFFSILDIKIFTSFNSQIDYHISRFCLYMFLTNIPLENYEIVLLTSSLFENLPEKRIMLLIHFVHIMVLLLFCWICYCFNLVVYLIWTFLSCVLPELENSMFEFSFQSFIVKIPNLNYNLFLPVTYLGKIFF